MTKNHTKKQIFLLIGIFCCIALGSNALNFSPNSSKTSEQSMDVRTAGTNNYRSNLSIAWGGIGRDKGTGIALDASGNIYITGYTLSFGAGSADAFIAKYDSAGNSLLNITWGGGSDDVGYGIALDDDGNIYITGYTLSFGRGGADAFIAKYDSSGNSLLNITWGGGSGDEGYGIALDDDGNIYITGYTFSYGTDSVDAFIAKYDSTGHSKMNITWGGGRGAGRCGEDNGRAIALDASGSIYITGYTEIFFAGHWGFYDAFIAKYSLVPDQDTPVISGYNLLFLIGFLGLFLIILTKKNLK